MIIPQLIQLAIENIPGAPNWVLRLITPINKFFGQVYSCLGNITVGENIPGQFTDVLIKTSATYSSGDFPRTFIAQTFKGSVRFIQLAQIQRAGNAALQTDPVTIDWIVGSNGIEIKYITGLQNSTSYNVRLLIL